MVSRYGLSMSLAVALAACGGSQPPVGGLDAMTQHVSTTSSYEVLYDFGRHPKPLHDRGGANPAGGLLNVGGTLYGTTEFGGYQTKGVVFSLTTAGAKKVLYRFRGSQNNDGAFPGGDLTFANGTLYGTTGSQGLSGCSDTVYSLTMDGKEKVLHVFCGFEHFGSPTGGVVEIKDTLYGTAGANESGIVYSVTTSGKYKVLYKFRGAPDGSQAVGNLLDVNGTLYSVTLSGGTGCRPNFGCGTVYSITTAGKEKVLYSFQGGADGLGPSAGLIDVNGTLYGVTAFGGAPSSSGCNLGCGTVYSVSTSGKHKVLYRFAGGSDAQRPDTNLVALNGTLYGTTAVGGSAGLGTIYSVTASGKEQVLHSFGVDDASPAADLIAINNTLYGTTYGGGGSSGCDHCGTVFTLTP